uniref:TNF alpha induced protein 1 n=1 Tax=Macaca fascicularis TaxID=9541 RepID=A0A7N9CF46_MACFA
FGIREKQNKHWHRLLLRLESLENDTITLPQNRWREFMLDGNLISREGFGVVGPAGAVSKSQVIKQYPAHFTFQQSSSG